MSMSGVVRRFFAGLMAVIAVLAITDTANADFEVTNTADSGPGSLRAGIDFANLSPSTSDLIDLTDLSGTITLQSSLPIMTGAIDVIGPGAGKLTVDGASQFQIFHPAADFSVFGLTMAHGIDIPPAGEEATYTSSGGAINAEFANTTTIIRESAFTANKAALGGAVYSAGKSLTIEDSKVTSNTADDFGGGTETGGAGVASTAPTTFIRNVAFSGNKASDPGSIGGGLLIRTPLTGGGRVEVNDGSFTGNEAATGAGAALSGFPLTLMNRALFAGNTASEVGGGLLISTTTPAMVSNVTVTDNEAGLHGSGIVVRPTSPAGKTDAVIDSATITGNTAPAGTDGTRGGGLLQYNGTSTVNNSIITGNSPEDLSTQAEGGGTAAIKGSFSLVDKRQFANFTETIANSNIYSVDPGLGQLTENGGLTKTMLPADTSPVVNKGRSIEITDQRNLFRPDDFGSIPFSTAAGANGADIGAVELQQPPKPPGPPNNFTFGKVKLNKKKGTATVPVKVPGKGRLLLVGSKTVKPQKETAKKKSTVTLTVKAKGKAAKALRKIGKTTVKARIKFTPAGGTSRTKSKTVKLAKKKRSARP